MDYDVNMILGDLSLHGANSIQELREHGKVVWRGYRIHYLKKKIFRVSRGRYSFVSYDLFGFYLSSFESALVAWGIPVPKVITDGKAARSGFKSWSLTRIREYNTAELSALVELANRLRESVKPLDLRISSWHGPGAFAGSWLGKNKITRLEASPSVEIISILAP